jgi:hypothetical protein
MFQNVLWIIRYQKRNKSLYFVNVFCNLCVLLNYFFEYLCLSNFIHMFTCNFIQTWICVISFEYVEIISRDSHFFSFEIKLVSNKKFSLKYLIQGFNPHLLSWFNVYPPEFLPKFQWINNKGGWLNLPLDDNWVVFCTIWIICIYLKITKFSNVNPYFLFVISLSLVMHSNVEPKWNYDLLKHSCDIFLWIHLLYLWCMSFID